MPILGCGAEVSKLLAVSDADVEAIESGIDTLMDAGVPRAAAQRQAVRDAIAMLGEERAAVVKALQSANPLPPVQDEPEGDVVESRRRRVAEPPDPLTEIEVIQAPGIATADRQFARGQIDARELSAAVRAEIERRQAAQERRQGADLTRGADWVRERLLRARRTGEMEDVQVELALWILNESPHLANDMAISLRKAKGSNTETMGTYNPSERLVTIFTNRADYETAAHEVLHHTERMLPLEAQDGIRNEWLNKLQRAADRRREELWAEVRYFESLDDTVATLRLRGDLGLRAELLGLMLHAARSGDDGLASWIWARGTGEGGGVHLRHDLPYELSSPSEYWAVHGAELMARKTDGWVLRAKEWLRGLIERVKSLFGLESDSAVISGLNAIINGIGEQADGRTMIARSPFGTPRDFADDSGEIMQSQRPLPLYSALAREIEQVNNKVLPVEGWRSAIKSLVNKGRVKAEEVTLSGLDDWLELQAGKVAKDDVLAFVKANGVRVEEVVLSDEEYDLQDAPTVEQKDDGTWAVIDPDTDEQIGGDYRTQDAALGAVQEMERRSEGAAKYSQYTLPGGTNYREVLLTLPVARGVLTDEQQARLKYLQHRKTSGAFDMQRGPLLAELTQLETTRRGTEYRSTHWDAPNVLAHIRVNDRTDADGRKVLFVEEVQSDWGQEGKKKGFAPTAKEQAQIDAISREVDAAGGFDKAPKELQDRARAAAARLVKSGTPSAPFVTATDKWLTLALKRIISMAANEGYDKVAFINGEQSAERYDLSKQIDDLRYSDSEGMLVALQRGEVVINKEAKPGDLPDLVGKEVADRLLNAAEMPNNGYRQLTGLDLKVGGEGMKAFYDKVIPAALKTLLKKLGSVPLESVAIRSNPSNGVYVGYEVGPGRAAAHAVVGVTADGRRHVVDQNGDLEAKVKALNAAIAGMPQLGFTITPELRETIEDGMPLFSNKRVHTHEMSTRIPSAAANERTGFVPEDASKKLLISDFSAALDQPKWLAGAASRVSQYPGYRPGAKQLSDQQVLARFVDFMVENLIWLHNKVDPEIAARSKLWYVGANAIALRTAEMYDVPDRAAAALFAVLSPQKDWFMNVGLGLRVADIYTKQQDHRWDSEMAKTASRILKHPKWSQTRRELKGVKLKDVDDLLMQAIWLRVFDEAHNTRSFQIVSPEGEFVGPARTAPKKGAPQLAKIAWGDFGSIAKAIAVMQDSSFENISLRLGYQHKVRNFYNNILVPFSPNGHATIDTHAVAAATMSALSGSSAPVLHNFGGISNNKTGLQGMFALYLQAYTIAARDLGLLPRELQSITWEAIRGVFSTSFKTANKAGAVDGEPTAVDRIWLQYKKGNISHAKARDRVLQLATGGDTIPDPAWARPGVGFYEEDPDVADEGEVLESRLPRGPSTYVGGATVDAAARADVSTIDVDGVQRPATNSEDQPIHPTEDGVRNFWKWFGDSKVVDEQGRPLVVMHASTYGDITQFDKAEQRFGKAGFGFYFSDAAGSNLFAEYGQRFQMDRSAQGEEKAVKTYPVYLSLQNPLMVDHVDDLKPYLDKGQKFGVGRGILGNLAPEAITALQRKGYDGIITRETTAPRVHKTQGLRILDRNDPKATSFPVYVAFEPSQIKSATGNSGAFDPDKGDIVASNPRRVSAPAQWTDATGRFRFKPGQQLYDMLGDLAGPLLSALRLRAVRPELAALLARMRTEVEQAHRTAVRVGQTVSRLTPDERTMISDFIEMEMRPGVVPPAHVVQIAQMMNTYISEQTDHLLELDMLEQQAADDLRGRYLPRFYESKLRRSIQNAWADALAKLTRKPKPMLGIKGNHLRGRGMSLRVLEEQIEDFKAAGWELSNRVSPNPDENGFAYMWRDFTQAEREDMGEIRDAGFRFVMGYMQTQKDIALGRLYEAIAADPSMAGQQPLADDWVQVPDTSVKGTTVPMYGALAGMFVHPDTMSQLSLRGEMESEVMRAYRSALSTWKEFKTVLNPVSHFNNVVSNLSMAHFAGVSYWDVHKYVGAARDLATNDPAVEEARMAGLFTGTFRQEELLQAIPPELRDLARLSDSPAKRGVDAAIEVLSWFLRRPLNVAYDAEDQFFRYLLYRDARGRGVPANDAVAWAKNYIFDYSDLPQGARAVRDFGIPFFSYTYKAVPVLLHTALTRLDRLAAPAAVIAAASAAAYAMVAGEDDEDRFERIRKYLTDPARREKATNLEKTERGLLPPWMKGKTALGTDKAVRVGTDPLTGLPLILDMSRVIPGGDLLDMYPDAGGLGFVLQVLVPNHPLLTTFGAMFLNRDFRSKDIVDPKADALTEKLDKQAGWLWKQFTPAVAVNQYHWDRLVNAAAAAGYPTDKLPDLLGGDLTGLGRDGLPVQPLYALLNTFGVKVRPVDTDMAAVFEESDRQKILRNLQAQMRALDRGLQTGVIKERTYELAKDRNMLKQERVRDGLTVDGNPRP